MERGSRPRPRLLTGRRSRGVGRCLDRIAHGEAAWRTLAPELQP